MTQMSHHRFLTALEGIEHGRLHLRTPEGHQYQFGSTGPEADMEIRDWAVLSGLTRHGNLRLGAAWIDEKWHGSSPEAVLALLFRNLNTSPQNALNSLRGYLSARALRRATRAPHWAGNEFFQMWLDPGMSLSGAMFDANDTLQQAQARSYHRILGKLAKGGTLLELGCRWGAFTEAAAVSGHHVIAEAATQAEKGYADARLDGRAQVQLSQLALKESFDNIVAIETLETVPLRAWPAFFARLKSNLAPGGRIMLQSVTVPDSEYAVHKQRRDLVRQQVMSRGTLPCNAIIGHLARGAGLTLVDSHAFGTDYARTCRHWRDNLLQNRARALQLGYAPRFLRGWQFYLEGCAAAFATGQTDVAQFEIRHANERAA